MSADGNYHILERLDGRPLQPRRGWTDETKAQLVEETPAPGANVSAIARRAGLSPSLLFGWRKKAIEGGVIHHPGSGEEDELSFARARKAFLAQIAVSKYADALPLFRHVKNRESCSMGQGMRGLPEIT